MVKSCVYLISPRLRWKGKKDSRIPGLDILRTQGRRIGSFHFWHDDDGEWDGAMQQQQQCQRRKEERDTSNN